MGEKVSNPGSFSFLHEQYEKALRINEESTLTWETYKESLEEVKKNLAEYSKHLKVPIMVPIGKKAFMKGDLVHTNECLVNLGDGWFVKQSAAQTGEFCTRRLEYCEEKLKSLKKESELLESHQNFPSESAAFPQTNVQEIIEPYDEEAEAEWRIKHREREREYRRKLAEQRKKEVSKKDEDVWEKLQRLESEESNQGEAMERIDELNAEDDEYLDEEDYSTDTLSDEFEEEEEEEEKEQEKAEEKGKAEPLKVEPERKRSITFNLEEPNDEDIIVIKFRHSKEVTEPSSSLQVDEKSDVKSIEKPSDIYRVFPHLFKPKSILKKSASLDQDIITRSNINPNLNDSDYENEELFPNMSRTVSAPVDAEPLPQVFGDIVERKVADTAMPLESEAAEEPPIPKPKLSKFKASRRTTS